MISCRRLKVLPLDVTEQSSVDSFVASVEKELDPQGLTAVVNNGGEGIAGPLEMLAIDDLRDQLEVNVVGPVRVTQAALPLLRRAGDRGRVVFVGPPIAESGRRCGAALSACSRLSRRVRGGRC